MATGHVVALAAGHVVALAAGHVVALATGHVVIAATATEFVRVVAGEEADVYERGGADALLQPSAGHKLDNQIEADLPDVKPEELGDRVAVHFLIGFEVDQRREAARFLEPKLDQVFQ